MQSQHEDRGQQLEEALIEIREKEKILLEFEKEVNILKAENSSLKASTNLEDNTHVSNEHKQLLEEAKLDIINKMKTINQLEKERDDLKTENNSLKNAAKHDDDSSEDNERLRQILNEAEKKMKKETENFEKEILSVAEKVC